MNMFRSNAGQYSGPNVAATFRWPDANVRASLATSTTEAPVRSWDTASRNRSAALSVPHARSANDM